jgi:uncharacterized circularly permuted ATP-grasp superfamily protein/uncharacterized alpha-E superfamily protein
LLAQAQACVATTGHFDELHGSIGSDGVGPSDSTLDAVWAQFFANAEAQHPSELDRRYASLQRQIRDNGVTYNVYADQEGPQRPWSLDLFPMIVDAASWQQIEAGVLQRMRLLESVMADVYGPQDLLKQGLLPPALVHGHPGYLRSMHGAIPAAGVHLHLAAFDLARGPDGLWWLIGQRCQAPSGLGYLLENRLAVARQFPQAFQALRVQRLAAIYRGLVASLKRASPAGDAAHIALLTPGPYNETYFEHAYLARYLGLSLVEGNDLIVRDEHLFLKTLQGLVPVHGLLKRVDDAYLDPLELRADSTLGVAGLLQAVRAGHVMLANAPGSAFLESPALLGFLPALARHVLKESLLLPSLPTWWCGERSAMQEVLPRLHEHTIKPTYPGSEMYASFESVMGRSLSPSELDAWAGRIARQGEAHTVQAFMPLSQIPTWSGGQGQMAAKSAMLRVFALSDGMDASGLPRWKVLPGGLVRIAATSVDIASMQRGGSSADAWVLTDGEVDTTAHMGPSGATGLLVHRKRLVTSRAAENLYWLGRYTERTENTIRLARLTLECLGGEDQTAVPLQQWLTRMAVFNTLVLPGVPSAVQARRVFERALISSLGATDGATSVGFNLRALKMAAAAVRERLSQEQWSVIVRSEQEFFSRCGEHSARGDYSATSALAVLKSASDHLAAITGAQTDRMTRDDGWRLLSIGRHIERLAFLANGLSSGMATDLLEMDGGFEAMLSLFDSTITFRAQYQQSRDTAALVSLVVLDRDNPRSLAWVAYTLRARLAKLCDSASAAQSAIAVQVPDPDRWNFSNPAQTQDASAALVEPVSLQQLLGALSDAAYRVSDAISATYFTHSGQTNQSLGA